jgi:dipeptidyl aminopeptidase/acylaminoacyl peptidase
LIVHGDQDKMVPIALGKAMYQATLKAGVKSKFVTIQGAGHGFTGKDDDRAMQEAISWFEEHLGAK